MFYHMDLMKVQSKKDLFREVSFDALCDHYGLLDTHLLPLLEVDSRTLKNWRLKDNAPMMARKLVAMHKRGFLSADWEGFYIEGDKLYTPTNRYYTTGEINGFYYKLQMINSYRFNNENLKLENARLKRRITSANDGIFRDDGTLKQLELI